jgi:hypothetical protein
MPEWWTYSLTDFLLFSPETYYRLFELYNAAVWPLQIVAAGVGLAVFAFILRRPVFAGRAVLVLLALAWAWIASAFFYERYATINWAAAYFAAGFAAQSLLLLAVAWTGSLSFEATSAWRRSVALGLLGFGIFAQPLIGTLAGRGWSGLELFGLAPDPTVIATLGALLAASGSRSWTLFVLPLVWCAIGGLTLWAMQAPDALLLPAAGLLSLLIAIAS